MMRACGLLGCFARVRHGVGGRNELFIVTLNGILWPFARHVYCEAANDAR